MHDFQNEFRLPDNGAKPYEEGYFVNQALAHNVRRLRQAQHMDKTVFSRATGISRPLLNKIESGQADVRLSYVQRLADALSVQPATLLHHPSDAERRPSFHDSRPWI